jgi:hypothetical protein
MFVCFLEKIFNHVVKKPLLTGGVCVALARVTLLSSETVETCGESYLHRLEHPSSFLVSFVTPMPVEIRATTRLHERNQRRVLRPSVYVDYRESLPSRSPNVPPLLTAKFNKAIQLQGYLPPQYRRMTPEILENALQRNCELLNLVVRESTIPAAGRGVFVTQEVKAHALLGWYWGKFVKSEEWNSIKTAPHHHDPSHQPGEEDFSQPARRGSWRAVTVPMTPQLCEVLLGSDQCPMSFINTTRSTDKQKQNCKICVPEEPFDRLAPFPYRYVEVRALRDLKRGEELFTEYGWNDADWKILNKVAKTQQAKEVTVAATSGDRNQTPLQSRAHHSQQASSRPVGSASAATVSPEVTTNIWQEALARRKRTQ